MDIMKILTALLGGAMSSGGGNDILKSILASVLAGQAGGGKGPGGPSLEDILGGASGKNGGGGLGDILGEVLGGGAGSGPDLSDILGGGAGKGPDLGDILGGVLGGGPGPGKQAEVDADGGIGDILSDAGTGDSRAQDPAGADSLEDLLGAALKEFGMAGQASQFSSSADRFAAHSPNLDFDRVNREAEILVKAMVNAAAADGRFDQSERSTILGSMGDLSQEEADFLNAAMSNPQDGAAFAQSVPKRMAQQVYTMSLTAIDLDSNPEAQYLHELARGLGIAPESANAIHRKLGAPEIYRA